MMTRFDKFLNAGDRVLFKEAYCDRAEYGEILVCDNALSHGVSYVVKPDDQDWAKEQGGTYEDYDDEGNTVWLVSVDSACSRDEVCRWDQTNEQLGQQIPETAPATPPNPKKIYGAQKPDLSLNPPVGDLHMAMAFENGASKYGAYNWRDSPVEAMTYIAAAKRHLDLWLDGQERSSDANVHNLGHVMACCAILLDSQELGVLIDNRPKPGASEAVQNRLKAQKAAALAAKLGK